MGNGRERSKRETFMAKKEKAALSLMYRRNKRRYIKFVRVKNDHLMHFIVSGYYTFGLSLLATLLV